MARVVKGVFMADRLGLEEVPVDDVQQLGTEIVALSLRFNVIARVTAGIAQLATLQKLDLRRNRLVEIEPGSLLGCRNLTHLLVDGNQLTSLPDDISTLPKLRVLTASCNRLEHIPDTLPASLVELDLHSNQLPSLPDLSPLASLSVLSVNVNKLQALPPSTSSLHSLTQFFSAGNRFTANELCLLSRLPNLTHISINASHVERLPRELACLPKLDSLHARFNQIPCVPLCLAHLASLQRLDVDGNPCIVDNDQPSPPPPAPIVPLASLAAFATVALVDNTARSVPVAPPHAAASGSLLSFLTTPPAVAALEASAEWPDHLASLLASVGPCDVCCVLRPLAQFDVVAEGYKRRFVVSCRVCSDECAVQSADLVQTVAGKVVFPMPQVD